MYLFYLTVMLSYSLLVFAAVKFVFEIILPNTKYEVIRLKGDIWALNRKLDKLNIN